jgi:hypothetical protein
MIEEYKFRADSFAREWQSAKYERGEAQTFWNEFLEIFGIDRKLVASFEEPIKKIDGRQGYIDMFWKGKVLIEHKSLGKDLDGAFQQAIDYLPNIPEEDKPEYIIVSDFQNFEIHHLESKEEKKFGLPELSENIENFTFLEESFYKIYEERKELNIKAGYLIGEIHDGLVESGYSSENLDIYLIRQLFMLFADSTGIWDKDLFRSWFDSIKEPRYIGSQMGTLFNILDTPVEKRSSNADELIRKFPYVNGEIFKENLNSAFFDEVLKEKFLKALEFDWSQINPVIFGSIFQASMDKEKRAELGSHFTSEENIFKLIDPLFLDDFWSEFRKNRDNKKKLAKLQQEIASLKFLDPACGSGNFLIVVYRELKLLEIEIIKVTNTIPLVSIEQFYGFEIDELASKITEVAMLFIEHQMNMRLEEIFQNAKFNIPVKTSANIFKINALKEDWHKILQTQMDYIIGNPPFTGARNMTNEQKDDVLYVFDNMEGSGDLDHVSAWYLKSADYMEIFPETKTALLSTNSVTQGQQVGILWNEILNNMGMEIHFAHQTFKWSNEAKANAQVHCVIVGFGQESEKQKYLFEYADIKGKPKRKRVNEISPYLVAKDFTPLKNLSKHIQKDTLEMMIGSKPIDGGNYIFTEEEKEEFLKLEPKAEKYFREFLGAKEFLNSQKRFILLLKDISEEELKTMPKVLERVEKVRTLRLESKSKPTQKLADTPTRFHIETIPETQYLAIPRVSSELRDYIPIGFSEKETLAGDSMQLLPNASLYEFGILTSSIHMAFMRSVAGRLKSDYRYSIGIVYNNFPFPQRIRKTSKERVEKFAQKILDVRKKYPEKSLAELYNNSTMPEDLRKAHAELDKVVDKLYAGREIKNDSTRVKKVLELRSKIMGDEVVKSESKRKRSIEKPIRIAVQGAFDL